MSSHRDNSGGRQEAQRRNRRYVWRAPSALSVEAGRLNEIIFLGLLVLNGGGLLTEFIIVGRMTRQGMFVIPSMFPLVLFMVGFFATCIGAVAPLAIGSREIQQKENANSSQGLNLGAGSNCRQVISLAFSDVRSCGALIGTVLFVLGSLVGLAELYFG